MWARLANTCKKKQAFGDCPHVDNRSFFHEDKTVEELKDFLLWLMDGANNSTHALIRQSLGKTNTFSKTDNVALQNLQSFTDS